MQNVNKELLRAEMKQIRKSIQNREEKDKSIFKNLTTLPDFIKADTVLIYASLDDEVSTDAVIEYTLSHNKTVALPVCSENRGEMSFYSIDSLSDLKIGSFGIREPESAENRKIVDFRDAFLVVPAICFDKEGFRLGYGGGYYDRFMKNFSSISAGLCYNKSIINNIPREKHDKSVDIIITETEIYYSDGGKNG